MGESWGPQIGSFAYMEKTITASFFGSGDPRREMPALLSLFLKKVRLRAAEY